MMFLPIFFLALPTLISTSSEKTYQFGIVDGAPESLNGSSNFSAGISNFRDCVSKCESDVTCILAYQETDSAPCFLFEWNSVTQVRDNASGGEGKVAFRLYTDQPVCELNLQYLLNGKTYPMMPNNTEEYLWRIDTSEFGWNITYIDCVQDDDLICGNFTYNRPYTDGCQSECLLTMVQLYAEMGPIPRHNEETALCRGCPPRVYANTTWTECVSACHADTSCFIVLRDDAEEVCRWYSVDNIINFMNKTSATSGKRAAIKLNLNNETCKYTTDQLLDNVFYMADRSLLTYNFTYGTLGVSIGSDVPNFMPYYRIRTIDNFYVINYYANESFVPQVTSRKAWGCPLFYDGMVMSPTGPVTPTCYIPLEAPGVTQTLAKQMCQMLGGDLMTEYYPNALADTYEKFVITYFPSWGYWQYKINYRRKFWLGLERNAQCDPVMTGITDHFCYGNGSWLWSRTDWLSYNTGFSVEKFNQAPQIPMQWADGEPAATGNCVYAWINPLDEKRTYMYVTDCNSTQVDGLICGSDPQYRLEDVPSYTSMAAKYGYI